MLSQRKTIAAYNGMLSIVNAQKESDNTVNLYTCENKSCGNTVKTVDVDRGTTPMVLDCLKCRGKMKSSFYQNIPDKPDVTMEFFRPELNKVLKQRDNQNLMNHILDGGLLLRPLQVEAIENPLQIAVRVLQNLDFKAMPTNEQFFETYVPILKDELNIENKVIKLKK